MNRADLRITVAVALGLAAMVLGAGGCQSGRAASTGASRPAVTSSTVATAGPAAPAGSSTSTAGAAGAATTAVPSAEGAPAPGPGSGGCHARGSGLDVLPDPVCTPGATNPAVTPADIDRTICRSGWTATVRPPVSYTEPLKYQQMTEYGDTGSAGAFEEDHLIPLELGGSPTSPRNLWPEPGGSPNPKDSVENAANRAVCNGQMALAAAQQAIAADWIAFGRQLGALPAPTPPPTTGATSSPAPGPAGSAGPGGTCTVTASYSSRYGDWDVYVHSDQPEQTAHVSTSGGATASYRTDSSGYADVYLHAPAGAAGQRVTVTVGSATCATTLQP